ncbi:MAG: nicotinate (nicotinamide) nucleotide adenylyltransferase [Balneolales bacterium]|nr:nicotinate (nicotinamide) nucleotide adenylyltransferase [Balneolales bacterium]
MAKRQIGLFGGSFDPPHIMHETLIDRFLASELCDEVWVLPAAASPFKENGHFTTFEHRLEMAKLAFGYLENVRVCDIERHLPQPSYTIQTVEFLLAKYPEYGFRICIGGDNLASFHKWKDAEKILRLTKVLVAERPDVSTIAAKNSPSFIVVPHKPQACSSTEVRKKLSMQSRSSIHQMPLNPVITDYILQNNLYVNT